MRLALVIENCVTMVSTVALVLGLYWMGAGGWSLWGLALLGNINTTTQLRSIP